MLPRPTAARTAPDTRPTIIVSMKPIAMMPTWTRTIGSASATVARSSLWWGGGAVGEWVGAFMAEQCMLIPSRQSVPPLHHPTIPLLSKPRPIRTASEHSIEVPRTARYYVLGDATGGDLWIVVHGFGQLAGDFIEYF